MRVGIMKWTATWVAPWHFASSHEEIERALRGGLRGKLSGTCEIVCSPNGTAVEYVRTKRREVIGARYKLCDQDK